MSDPTACFTFLSENVPLWIVDLGKIEKKIQDRHDEIARVPVPLTQNVRKTGSNESIRLNNEPRNGEIAIEVTSAPQAEDIAHPPAERRRDAPFLRKRKTASVLSSNLSGPSKYRTRSTLEVYYDSEVQKSFEGVVRNIGTGRNLLRKAKMAARMAAFVAAAEGDEDNADDSVMPIGKIGYRPRSYGGLPDFKSTRPRMGPNLGGLAGSSDTTGAFDTADKALERAQGLCERAAHQFLRDGDCRVEIAATKERFEHVITTSQEELARLKAKEEERGQAPSKQEERTHAPLTQSTKSDGFTGLALDVDDDTDVDLPLPPVRLMART